MILLSGREIVGTRSLCGGLRQSRRRSTDSVRRSAVRFSGRRRCIPCHTRPSLAVLDIGLWDGIPGCYLCSGGAAETGTWEQNPHPTRHSPALSIVAGCSRLPLVVSSTGAGGWVEEPPVRGAGAGLRTVVSGRRWPLRVTAVNGFSRGRCQRSICMGGQCTAVAVGQYSTLRRYIAASSSGLW